MSPLLPERANTHRFGGGRPRVPDRCCADAIFYVLRTGGQWASLRETGLCAKSTAHDRFSAWVEEGIFLRLWQAGVGQFDELQGIDWSWLSMDEAMAKAPLGGEKAGPNPTDRGTTPAGCPGVKRSLLTEGHGVPIGVAIDGANRHDMKLVREADKRARRWVMERSHSRLNRCRRILVRWEKKSAHYLAFLHFACALSAWRAAGVLG